MTPTCKSKYIRTIEVIGRVVVFVVVVGIVVVVFSVVAGSGARKFRVVVPVNECYAIRVAFKP
jgi:hypothetical protein